MLSANNGIRLAAPVQLIVAVLLWSLQGTAAATTVNLALVPPEIERACPDALRTSLTAWQIPEVTAPAHRMDVALPWLPADSPPLRITVWRTACPNDPSRLRAWLRFSNPLGPAGKTLPTVSIIQGDRTIGRFAAITNGYGAAYFRIQDRRLGPNDQQGSIYSSGALINDSPNETFDPAAAFAMELSYLDHFGTVHPTVTIQIPDAAASGNIGFMPRDIAVHWSSPSLPGTGLILQRNERETLFAAWMTYDENGRTTWFVMPEGLPTGTGTIDGRVYSPRGPAYPIVASQPPQSVELGSPVGTFSFRFASANSAEFKWSVQGVERIEQIEPLRVAAPTSYCSDSSKPLSTVETASGWGVGITGQVRDSSCQLHTTLLTYDSASRPVWYFAALTDNGEFDRLESTSMSGPLEIPRKMGAVYQPTGTAFSSTRQNRAFALGQPVGVLTSKHLINKPLFNADHYSLLLGSTHLFSYTIRGVPMDLDLKRFTFEY